MGLSHPRVLGDQSQSDIPAPSDLYPINRMSLTNESLHSLSQILGISWPTLVCTGHCTLAGPAGHHGLDHAASGLGAEFCCSSVMPRYRRANPGFGRMWGVGAAQILPETKELTCKEFQREPRSPSLPPSPFPVHVSLLSAPRFRERHSLGCVKTTTPLQQGN